MRDPNNTPDNDEERIAAEEVITLPHLSERQVERMVEEGRLPEPIGYGSKGFVFRVNQIKETTDRFRARRQQQAAKARAARDRERKDPGQLQGGC